VSALPSQQVFNGLEGVVECGLGRSQLLLRLCLPLQEGAQQGHLGRMLGEALGVVVEHIATSP